MHRLATALERENELRERDLVCGDLVERIIQLRAAKLRTRDQALANVHSSTHDRFVRAAGEGDRRVLLAEQLLRAARAGELSKQPDVDYGDGAIVSPERASALWAIRLQEGI